MNTKVYVPAIEQNAQLADLNRNTRSAQEELNREKSVTHITSGSTEVLLEHHVFLITSAVAGTGLVLLPADMCEGLIYRFKVIFTLFPVTVAPYGAELLDGVGTPISLVTGDSVSIVSDGVESYTL